MTELDRVLDAVLHDVRSPLSAATGYLRLVRDGRMPPGVDAAQIIEQVQASLRLISTICTNAEAWRRTPPERSMTIAAARMAEDLAEDIDRHGVHVDRSAIAADFVVTLAGEWRELCPVLGDALSTVARPRGDSHGGCVTMRERGGRVAFESMLPPLRSGFVRSPFDPWSYPGLTVARALHDVEQAGGQWQFDDAAQALRISFDVVPILNPQASS